MGMYGEISKLRSYSVSYQVKIKKNKQIPLPDSICRELGINIGDILICESVENSSKITMRKHVEQTLSDAAIASAGNLTRVVPYTED